MNILFWNIHKKNSFFDVIASFVKEEDIDIVFLAEFPTGEGNEKALETVLQNSVDSSYLHLFPYAARKIETFTRIGSPVFESKEDKNRYSVFSIWDPSHTFRFNLFVCHLVDRINYSADSQGKKASIMHREIEAFEDETECRNSIICGDFNMNPFEKGMYYADSFNAVMEKRIANYLSRKVDGFEYRYFYNPMWGYMGDLGNGSVPGTYYQSASGIDVLHWHLLDQVIIRPSVIPFFDDKELKILSQTSQFSLLTNQGIINKNDYSDHLPIKFKISI